jgi:cyclopropane-fatty-acyl-phospholipid synthase
MAWSRNFTENWPRFEERYDETVFRMWDYYLRHFAGTFRARMNQLWQFVFSKKGLPGGYLSIR